mgnify:CR=1 FL=1
MKTILLFILLIFTQVVNAQTYSHPTTGIAGEYVGACETATCSGTYTDNGGSGSNYSNNINSIYRVFCPNTAGNCVRMTFNSFDVEPTFWFFGTNYTDYLMIGNGPTQNSPLFTSRWSRKNFWYSSSTFLLYIVSLKWMFNRKI